MLAIIGGSGFYNLGREMQEENVITPFGIVAVYRTTIGGSEVFFIPRHGKNHELPPHKINYRANIYALKKLGTTAAFATYAAGIISRYKPGDLILIDDFIGFNSPITLFDSFAGGMKHVDFSQPFEKEFVNAVLEAAVAAKVKLKKGGIIAATHGPRFETRAEIKALKRMGANLVSMTAGYEITLMREAEIDFAAVAVGANYATGISKKQLTVSEIMNRMTAAKADVNALVWRLVDFVK